MSETAEILAPAEAPSPELRTPNAPAEGAKFYDIARAHSIPWLVEDCEIEFQCAGVSDEQIVEYESYLNSRIVSHGSRRNGFTTESNADAASDWLFDAVISGVTGIGEPGEELPPGWKSIEPIPSVKEEVVQKCLLLVEEVEPPAKPKAALKWGQKPASDTVVLRALYEGHQLRLTHHVKPETAGQRREYERITKARAVQGTKAGMLDLELPSAMKAKAELYRQLCTSCEGYAGAPPIHHQAAVVDAIFARSSQAIAKN